MNEPFQFAVNVSSGMCSLMANSASPSSSPIWGSSSDLLVTGLLGFLVSWGLSAFILNRVRLKWIKAFSTTHPTAHRAAQFHHQHSINSSAPPIPRYGGIGIVAAFILSGALATLLTGGLGFSLHSGLAILISCLAIFAVGITDDFNPLGAKKKLLLQFVCASLAFLMGIQINSFKIPFTDQILELSFTASLIITVIWLVALTNLMNLIDGMDGLAGGIGVLLMGLLAWSAGAFSQQFHMLVSIGVLGGLVGFLRFNFPPARIYLGDGGAYFLGFLIGCLSIETSHKGTVVAALTAPLLALALPILDTSLAIIRRAIKGLPLFRPDMDHLHHKLMQQGITRTRAVLTLYAISTVALLLAFGLFLTKGVHLPLALGTGGAILILMLRHFGLIPRFSTLRELVRSSLRLRRHSKYALTMGQWLEMEAERGRSLPGLWKDYTIMVERLGMTGVRIETPDQVLEQPAPEPAHGRTWTKDRRVPSQSAVVSFSCPEGRFSLKEFDHLCELATEAWVKAMVQWERHSIPAHSGSNSLKSVAGSPSDSTKQKQFHDSTVTSTNPEP